MSPLNEYEGRILELLLKEGSMTPSQLAAFCKKAFGWKRKTLRSAEKSLLSQGLISKADGRLAAAITQEAFRELNWNQWISGSFDWAPAPQPPANKTLRFYQNSLFWSTCFATATAIVLLLLLLPKPPQPAPATPLPETSVATPSFPEELVICRDTLAEWQALDSFAMTTTETTYNNSSTNTVRARRYWFSETDWLYLTTESASYSVAGYMFRDGNLYTSVSAAAPIWALQKENSEIVRPELWLMEFDWDKFELYHLETVKSNAATLVRCSAKSREGITTVYELQFKISSGKLEQLTVIQTKLDGIITKDTYILSSSDAEEIAQYIANQREISFNGGLIPSGDIPE